MSFFIRLSLILLTLPLISAAEAKEFVPLIGIPGLSGQGYTVNTYIQALYILTISLTAFLVVVKLILAGFQYMVTDIVPQKEQAKKSIKNAFLGLFIILGAVVILNTINPQLTNLTALELDGIEVTVRSPYGEGVPGGSGGDRGEQNAQCETEEGGIPIHYGGQNRQFVCCTSAGDHPRCENYFSEIPVATERQERFSDLTEAETAAAACGGRVETQRSRVHYAICPTAVSEPVAYNGEEISNEDIFTVWDPAIPELDLEAEPNHQNQVRVVGVQDNLLIIYDIDDDRTYRIGCDLLQPVVPGC